GVGHHQHEAGGDDAVEDCHHQRVDEPLGELSHAVRVEEHVGVVIQRIAFGEEGGEVDAAVAGERGGYQPDDGYQPDGSQHQQDQMPDGAADAAVDLALAQLLFGIDRHSLCQENVASFLLMNRKHTTVNTAQMMNTMMPMTAAIL